MRITTNAQAAAAHGILAELGHDAVNCPALPLTDDINNKKLTLIDCAVAPTNNSEAEVAKFEKVIIKLNKAIP